MPLIIGLLWKSLYNFMMPKEQVTYRQEQLVGDTILF